MDEHMASLYNAGVFDRLVSRFSNIDVKTIGRNNRDLTRIVNEERRNLGATEYEQLRAFHDLVEAARLGVNEANRRGDSESPIPGPDRVPTVEHGSRGRGSRLEVHVIVEMVDTTTGGTARFPLVIDSTAGMSADRLNAEAAALATQPEHWQTTGQRGDVARERAQFVRLTVIAIIGRE